MGILKFDEKEIQQLFGHEAAEDETPERLKEYYFKTNIYEKVTSDLPLRILVGHKGIGKSALFYVAMSEDKENNRLPVLIQPDDIAELGVDTSDFLKTIRDWKEGIVEIITRKVLSSLGKDSRDVKSKLANFSGNIIDFLYQSLKGMTNFDFSESKQTLVNNFLKFKKIYIYFDDLDRGWKGRETDIIRISALLNAVRDIIREVPGLYFRIGLRSDVYYLVRTSDESTDKIEGSVIWQSLTNHEIFIILIKRIETFFNRKVDENKIISEPQINLSRYLNPVFESRFSGRGHWENAPIHRVLMSLIRKRPRDLIKLCTLAAKDANNNQLNKIYTQNFEKVFTDYSLGRLQDTQNEFESELRDISRLILNMKPNKREKKTQCGFVYKTEDLLAKIKTIQERGEFKFTNGKVASTKDLAAFLYKINFLTARKETPDGIIRYYFEENRYISNEFADFGFDWEVHPAYRWALQPENIMNIYDNLELSTL